MACQKGQQKKEKVTVSSRASDALRDSRVGLDNLRKSLESYQGTIRKSLESHYEASGKSLESGTKKIRKSSSCH